jgi:negative regulator of flagellin synthesis FlgM
MVIDKIGNINNIVEPKKTRATGKASEVSKNDSIQISSEGKKAAELAKINHAINNTPDIRAEKVQDIKARIQDGSYNFDDNSVLEMVADKIAAFLLRP